MRKRLMVLGAAAVLAAPAGAEAKEITAVEVCGPDACRSADPDAKGGLHAFVRGGSPTAPPDKGSPFYRATITVAAGHHRERMRLVASPAAGLVRVQEGVPSWIEMTRAEQRAYERVTAGIVPFAAAELPGVDGGQAPAEREEPPPSPDSAGVSTGSEDGAGAGWLLGGGLLLGGIAAAVAWRRRRSSG